MRPKVLLLSAEAVPFAKSGGLADAVPALAAALESRGWDAGILMPRHYSTDRAALEKLPDPLGVPMGQGEMWCAVYRTALPGTRVPVWMLDREDLYGRSGLYGPDGSSSWPDNALRFAFLSAAAFQLSRYLRRIPEILHLHDWQAAPAAWMLDNRERRRGFQRTASVITIHNLGYQGVFPASDLSVLPPHFDPSMRQRMLFDSRLNFLAAGLKCADAITTVSPTYAKEILTREFSEGLGELLTRRSERITGILNGMDYSEWNPGSDPSLKPHNYGALSLRRKARLKRRLQEEAGLPVNPELPVFGMVARLTGQKGVDLLAGPECPALDVFKSGRAQLVVLGTGERRWEEALRDLEKAMPRHCSIRIAFSDSYSRLIEAGSDFFLMPSRYEPCGLNQMYSLRYGTLPIVRRTGGLADTVVDAAADGKRGNGFVFDRADPRELNTAIQCAMALYSDRRRLNGIRRRGMSLRFDWASSAAEYERVFEEAIARHKSSIRNSLKPS